MEGLGEAKKMDRFAEKKLLPQGQEQKKSKVLVFDAADSEAGCMCTLGAGANTVSRIGRVVEGHGPWIIIIGRTKIITSPIVAVGVKMGGMGIAISQAAARRG